MQSQRHQLYTKNPIPIPIFAVAEHGKHMEKCPYASEEKGIFSCGMRSGFFNSRITEEIAEKQVSIYINKHLFLSTGMYGKPSQEDFESV